MHWVYLLIDVLLLSDVYLSLGLKKKKKTAKLTSGFNQNCRSIALLILALLSSV